MKEDSQLLIIPVPTSSSSCFGSETFPSIQLLEGGIASSFKLPVTGLPLVPPSARLSTSGPPGVFGHKGQQPPQPGCIWDTRYGWAPVRGGTHRGGVRQVFSSDEQCRRNSPPRRGHAPFTASTSWFFCLGRTEYSEWITASRPTRGKYSR